MTDYELLKLRAQREILQHIKAEYGDNRSLGNVLQNINQRIKGEDQRRDHDREPV